MSRLPTVGGDDNTWGNILNDFLGVEHNADGTLKNVARPSDLSSKADNSTVAGKLDKSTVTTKGDLLAATGSAAISRLGVGSDGTVLTADSTQSAGVKWGAVAGSAEINAVADYGLSTSGTASANKTALTNAFSAAISGGKGVFLPAGTYNLASGLQWASDVVRLRGAGRSTVLNFTDHTNSLLTIGDNSGSDSDIGSDGWLEHFNIVGPNPAPSTADYNAALLMNHVRHARVSYIYVGGMDVGVDLINNCYGIAFDHLMAPYSTTNVAIRLRHGTQSGDDIVFWYPWVGGKVAAVWMESQSADGTSGYRFIGGQLSSSGNGTNDTITGVVMAGGSYDGSTSGGAVTNVSLEGVLFEGVGQKNMFRWNGEGGLTCRSCRFDGGSPQANGALGLLNASSLDHTTFRFEDCYFENNFSNASPIVMTGPTGNTQLHEIGSSGLPIVNGVSTSLFGTSFAEVSNYSTNTLVIRGGAV